MKIETKERVLERRYWLRGSNKETISGVLAIQSANFRSLAFVLDAPRSFPVKGGGLGLTSLLPLLFHEGVYFDILSGTDWEIFDEAPQE